MSEHRQLENSLCVENSLDSQGSFGKPALRMPPGTKDFSFPKEDRLLKPDEFARVRRAGKRLFSRSFTLYMLPNGLGRRRLGLSASSKAGNSVNRNRVKRLIREFFRMNRDLFPESVDVLVTVKSLEHIKGLADVADELARALQSARSGK